MKNLIKKMAIATIALTMFSCSDDDNNSNQPQTIADIAIAGADFSTLERALVRTNLVGTLDGTGSFTVFAPTNDAFNRFFTSISTPGNAITVENVPVETLRGILLNHVINEEITSANIPASVYKNTLSPFSSATGAPTISMFIQKEGGVVTLNGGLGTTELPRKGAVVTTADVDASNGVIHVVNRVIQIPNIVDHAIANPNFSTLTSLLVARGLVPTLQQTNTEPSTLAPFTVFAPVNSAFSPAVLGVYNGLANDDLRTQVLTYHVVSGLNVRANAIPSGNIPTVQGQGFTITGTAINDAGTTVNKNIILTDVQCSNGVVHAIDGVLLPSFN
ncbi:MAG: fasciclin [Flavobacteriaceae bacterium]|nr:MAG: fasciclin [Flavobacteriaceae bacterium]